LPQNRQRCGLKAKNKEGCGRELSHRRTRALVQLLAAPVAWHAVQSDTVATQHCFYVIERVTYLRSERLAGGAMRDVLIVTTRKFSASAEGLPQADCWNVSDRFIWHESFDSVSAILVHDEFLTNHLKRIISSNGTG
jgi:hypothetical protein